MLCILSSPNRTPSSPPPSSLLTHPHPNFSFQDVAQMGGGALAPLVAPPFTSSARRHSFLLRPALVFLCPSYFGFVFSKAFFFLRIWGLCRFGFVRSFLDSWFKFGGYLCELGFCFVWFWFSFLSLYPCSRCHHLPVHVYVLFRSTVLLHPRFRFFLTLGRVGGFL